MREGVSPYADPDDPTLDLRHTYVYPPQVAIGLVPLTWLPVDLAAFLVFVASVAALLGAVALVGVRDVRCYAAVLLWAPTWNSLDTLNVSSALALGVALLWRFRSTLWPLGATLGVMVSVKLFLWPMLVWVGLTRRPPAAILALVFGLGVTLASWAAIGFAGLADYPELLSRVDDQENYSIVAIAESSESARWGSRSRRSWAERSSLRRSRAEGGNRRFARSRSQSRRRSRSVRSSGCTTSRY